MAMGSQDYPFLSANGYRYGGYSYGFEKKLAKDNPSSPYYLSKSEEHPTLLLTTHLLTLSNYHLWRQDVLLSLLEKRKLGFVDGSIKPLSPDDVNYECWRSCSDMVQSWIIHSLSPEVSATVSSSSSCARVLWLNLQEWYSKGNKRSRIRIAQLQHDISRLSQGYRSVADYFSEFKQLWDELENLSPIPVCKCFPACNCDALAIICNYRREEKLLKFLNGLVFNFARPNPFKYRILLTEPLPTVDQVFAMPETQSITWNQTPMDTTMKDDNPFKNGILMTEPLPTFALPETPLCKIFTPDTTMEAGKSKSEQSLVDNPSNLYSHGNKSRIRMQQLHHDVSKIRQGCVAVSTYFAEFKQLWDELVDFWPIPICKCSPACKCDALSIIRNYRDEDQIVRFLNGLDEEDFELEPVKNCILLTEPLPTLDQVLAMVEQAITQRRILRTRTQRIFTYYFASASDPVAVVPTSFPLQSTWYKKLASGNYFCNLCGKECRPSVKHGMAYAGCQQLVGPGGKFRPWIYIHKDNSVTNSADCQHLAPRLSGNACTSPPFFNSVVVPMDTTTASNPRDFDQQILDPGLSARVQGDL